MHRQTIVVTGANGQVGQRLLTALQATNHTVIALVRTPIELPATEVIANWLPASRAKAAIAQADAVVHLAGTLKPFRGDYVSANVRPTEALISALTNQTKRIVFLSYVGASEQSANAYLAAKAQAETLLQQTGLPLTIFRCPHIIGPPEQPGPTATNLLSQQGKAVTVLGSGRQRVTPIYLDDVVSAILAALHQAHNGRFELAGPDLVSMDELVRILNAPHPVNVRHLPPALAKLLPWIVADLPAALVDVMLQDSVGNAQAAIEAFHLKLTSLQQVWSPEQRAYQLPEVAT